MIKEYEGRWKVVPIGASQELQPSAELPWREAALFLNVSTLSGNVTLDLPAITDVTVGTPIMIRKSTTANTLHIRADRYDPGNVFINNAAGIDLTAAYSTAWCMALGKDSNWGAALT